MKRVLLCLTIVLILGGFGFAASTGVGAGANVGAKATPTPDLGSPQAPAEPTADCAAEVTLFENPFTTLEASSVTASNCCLDRCRKDRDCDGVCGAGAGVCVQVNSCCKGCACAF